MNPGDCKIQNSESNWYALYACSGHEQRSAEQIEPPRPSCFLPFYRSLRRRKDRRKELELVLFPGFVFVPMKLEDRSRVLQLPGVVRVVSFDGRPAALPVSEIEWLRERLSCIQDRTSSRSSHGSTRSRNGPCKGPRESGAGKNRAGLFSPSMSFSDQSRSTWMRPI
jgi:transcription antitermination factor NusG